MREEKPKLSAIDRLYLIQTINALPTTQFDELVFALDPPKGVVASNTAPQGQRSKELLDWLEGSSGPGLAVADKVLQVLIPKATRTAPQPVAFAISGKMGDLPPSELEAIVELLRQKTGDASLVLAFSTEGSIKLILNGSLEGLAKLQEMFEEGGLEQLNLPSIEAVTFVDRSTKDARKARFIQVLRLRNKALLAFAPTIDIDINSAVNHALALCQDIDQAFNLYRILDLDLEFDLTLQLSRAITLYGDIDIDYTLTQDRALKLYRDLNLIIDLYLNIDRALPRDRSLKPYLALYIALNKARDRALTLYRALKRIRISHYQELDLNGVDLRGANLRNINLTGANLTNTDLTYADVTGTFFRDNPGLTEADKRNLQSRGAIILDPPSSDVPALVLQ